VGCRDECARPGGSRGSGDRTTCPPSGAARDGTEGKLAGTRFQAGQCARAADLALNSLGCEREFSVNNGAGGFQLFDSIHVLQMAQCIR
jgi:hypothetical protein